MKLILLTFVGAIVVGLIAGGHLRGLSSVRLRWPYLALGGILLQLLPIGGWEENVLVMLSFALLCVFAVVNLREPGFVLVLIGLALNLLVISVNQGMPVSDWALIQSDQQDTLSYLVHHGGAKHHLATSDDVLRFLGDVIPIPAPVSQAASVGDLIMYAGAGWFIVSWMRRPADEVRDEPLAPETPP